MKLYKFAYSATSKSELILDVVINFINLINYPYSMSIPGYIDYKRREFCNDVKCPVQLLLNKQKEDSEEYENIRQICKTNCIFTTYQFHHWLIEKGYLIIRPEKRV